MESKQPSIVIIDNYDSFTYNIVNALRLLGIEPTVVRNDKVNLDDLQQFDKIILSPGPGIPSEAGLMPAIIERYASSKPILGICLGHQALAEHFGARLINLPKVYHGLKLPLSVTSPEADYLFDGLPERFDVGRYHSWAVDPLSVPECLEVTAVDDDGNIMALRHRELDIRGVQFHPESIMTDLGQHIFKNWLSK
ncbi:MAG: aminodeoxychorismate/anthranilate synthase component II [Muribaculaceae bacterium]|nr:aminodeoxychorismate/anthranilate synthase component II [Muribaculaceae bacterium]